MVAGKWQRKLLIQLLRILDIDQFHLMERRSAADLSLIFNSIRLTIKTQMALPACDLVYLSTKWEE